MILEMLIVPKASSINSRSFVDLNKTFMFNNNLTWTGILLLLPLTTIGTLEVYKTLSKYNILTALHKFIKLEDLTKYNENNPEDLLT